MIYQLSYDLIFPPAERADGDGLLAVGGDLSPERLLLAYQNGIFPWYNPGDPILWWSPDPRMILYPNEVHVSRRMMSVMKSKQFSVSLDKNFTGVITQCQIQPRKGQEGTWITKEMKEAYIQLHRLGYAHSVEVWQGNMLAGGLYGVSLGRCFFGESMFTKVSNASKVALITLADILHRLQFGFIDCQVYSPHLESLGAIGISRKRFLAELSEGLQFSNIKGDWSSLL